MSMVYVGAVASGVSVSWGLGVALEGVVVDVAPGEVEEGWADV